MEAVVSTTDPGGVTAVRTLLLIDLVDSTRWLERLGDRRAAEVLQHHDRLARDLLARHGGREIDKTDGFLFLFERPAEAVRYALDYHRSLQELSRHEEIPLQARAAVHLGEVFLRENRPEDVARGAKPLEVEGLAKPTTARLLSLARGRQTLLTRSAFDLARQVVDGGDVRRMGVHWLAHGPYRFQGVSDPVEVFEVGEEDIAPLEAPTDSLKAQRVVAAGDELTLGWRPAAGLTVPRRPSWVLEERLGEGGFGEVWRAVQEATGDVRVFKFCYETGRLRALQREVTLFRLLKESLGDRDDIARIIDWSFDEAPYFLEAEYTDGGNLTEWFEEHGGAEEVPVETRLELAAQIADALAAAHSVGVLHKDVKPTNVLIYEGRDGAPRVRLTDFGIGRVTEAGVLAGKGITVFGLTGMVASEGDAVSEGTQLYMAPELLEGKPASMQADLYALGVLLYQLVAGDLTRALASGWRRDMPDALLAEDVASLVDRDPSRRPANAGEVARRLRTLEERRAEREAERRAREEAEEARRALERAQRRRKTSAAIAVAAVVVLAIVSILAIQAMRARNEAERRRGQAEELIGFMVGDLRAKLEPLGQLPILSDVGDKALEYFDAVPEERLTGEELFRRAQALQQISDVRVEEGDLDAALKASSEALQRMESLVERDPEHGPWLKALGESHFYVGAVHWRRGELDAVLDHFDSYLATAGRLVRLDPSNPEWQLELSYAHSNIASVLEAKGDLEGALEELRAVLPVRERLVELRPEDPQRRLDLARAHNKMGVILLSLGSLSEALEHFRADLGLKRRLVNERPDHAGWRTELAYSHNYVGLVLEFFDELTEAREHVEEALVIMQGQVASDPTNARWRREVAVNHHRLGVLLLALGEPKRALSHFRTSLTTLEDLVAANPSDVDWRRVLAFVHEGMARALLDVGDLVAAGRHTREALRTARDLSEENPESPEYLRILAESETVAGRLERRQGNEERARELWEVAAERLEPLVDGSSSPVHLVALVEPLLLLGRLEQARPLLELLEEMGYRQRNLQRWLREAEAREPRES